MTESDADVSDPKTAREYVEDRLRFFNLSGCWFTMDNRRIRLDRMNDADAVLIAGELKKRREKIKSR